MPLDVALPGRRGHRRRARSGGPASISSSPHFAQSVAGIRRACNNPAESFVGCGRSGTGRGDISENTSANSNAEEARIRAVERYRILDAAPGAVLNRIAGLATRSLDTPMAVISIVHRDRIWFAAAHGVDEVLEIARGDGMSAFVIDSDVPLVISDAITEPRAADMYFVRQHHVRFFAGAPIVSFDGHRLGAVAVMDTRPRTFSADQIAVLGDLAAIVMEQLEQRLLSLDSVLLERRLRGAAENARDKARRGRDSAEAHRDEAERDRDHARWERDQAQMDREAAVRDRGIAERDRDQTEEFASVLQRTLLPPSLPEIDGMTVAAFCRPISSREVGGDFYDLFALGGDRWAYFIGDVLGHGADAAVVTSLIRYTLRSAALHYSDPTGALAELNAVLLRETQPRRFCTVNYGTIRPLPGGGFTVTIATGGHPSGLLIDPCSGTVEEIRPRGGMLVGALPEATFDVCTVTVRAGQILLFYTDGLTEARRGDDPFDDGSLMAFVAEYAGGGVSGLMEALATLVPKLDPHDDIAILALQADDNGT
jgi:sigma-B regulation protein RsbU (phosphoserine phosphatase)